MSFEILCNLSKYDVAIVLSISGDGQKSLVFEPLGQNSKHSFSSCGIPITSQKLLGKISAKPNNSQDHVAVLVNDSSELYVWSRQSDTLKCVMSTTNLGKKDYIIWMNWHPCSHNETHLVILTWLGNLVICLWVLVY